MAIRWTRVHTINTFYLMRSHPMLATLTRLMQRRIKQEHSPTRRKKRGMTSINVGRQNANALPPQYNSQGPLTHGPFIYQPFKPQRGTTQASAWTRVALPRVCTTSVPPRRRMSSRDLTKRFSASLKHKNVTQTKFIKPNSQR